MCLLLKTHHKERFQILNFSKTTFLPFSNAYVQTKGSGKLRTEDTI